MGFLTSRYLMMVLGSLSVATVMTRLPCVTRLVFGSPTEEKVKP